MRRPRGVLPLALVVICAACTDTSQKPPPVPADAIPAGTRIGTAAITGRVLFSGTVKPPEAISMSSDAACHKKQDGEPTREDLLVGAGGALRNVFVHVATGLEGRHFAPPAVPVQLDQRGCTYRPHVVGLQVGQQLLLVNSDPTLHNVHTLSTANKPFNFGMSVEGQKSARYFAAPEVMIRTKCDVHPWMGSWIGVVPHPFFAVTGADGAFSLSGLPAGQYVIEAWHETAGAQRQTVSLADGETKEITFTYAK